MNTLVIHPKDKTTDFLCEIYKDMNCTIIRNCREPIYVLKQVLNHDRVIFLGHGTPYGLLGSPINRNFVPFIANNPNNVYIWCYANEFVKANKLKGFASGMIISEELEAIAMGFHEDSFSIKDIEESNRLFAEMLKNVVQLPTSGMLSEAKIQYKSEINPIMVFNQQNLYFYE